MDDVEAKAVAKDDSDDDEDASVGQPCRKTGAAMGGRGAVVMTGQPKVGQDPDDPADRATEARSAKVPPKSGCGVPARAVFGGRSVPIEIVNGSSRDKASFVSGDEFASKEEDNKRDPDKDIATATQFALGVASSDEAWAAAARLPGAVVVRRALAALPDNTKEEASSAAASDSKAAAQGTLRNGGEPDKEAKFGANWQAKREGHTRKEAGRATKRKSHHPGGPTPQVLTADKDANVAANWQAKEGGHPSEEASWATKRKANHAAHQGGGTRSPQGLTALFGPTAGKNQGRTRQRRSAADFYPPPGRPETRRPGCRPRGATKKPPMRLPRGRQTTQLPRAVEHAAPKCRRRFLVPPWENFRGKPDSAEALPIFYRPPGRAEVLPVFSQSQVPCTKKRPL